MSTIRDVPRRTADLQTWLADRQSEGRLGEVATPVTDVEVAALLEATDGRRCLRFHQVRDADMALVGNTLNSREDVAAALGCPIKGTVAAIQTALQQPQQPRRVGRASAPILAHSMDPGTLLAELPVIRQHEHDAGRYLTAGVLITRDPHTGRTDLSINRLQWVGESELRVLVLPGRLAAHLAAAESEGNNLDVAVAVGNHPAVTLASQAPPWPRLDDLQIATAMAGSLDVVDSPELNLPVPADAQILLEGRFRCGHRAPEGPFGEFPRTYGPRADAPIIDLVAAHHREDAVYQSIQSGSREHFLLGGVLREVQVLAALQEAGVSVAGVRLPESGSCRLQAVVALAADANREQAEAAVRITFDTVRSIKHVLVVDNEVNIYDDEQLGWVLATRVRADRDLMLVPAPASILDPTAEEGWVTKLGVLAVVGDNPRHARMTTGAVPTHRLAALLAEACEDSSSTILEQIGSRR